METTVVLPKDTQVNSRSLLYKLPLVLIGVGIASLLYWWVLRGQDHERAMYGYLFSYLVLVSLVLGSLAFVLIQHVTRAGWSVVIRRIPETVISLAPVLILLFIPIALFTHDIFPWTHTEHVDDILRKKLPYLNEPFFLARSFGYLLVWSIMGIWFYRMSLSQDDTRKDNNTRIMQALSAPSIIIFGLTLTFASFDWIMSLQPHWYSTIFGVYFFAGSLLFALAFMTLVAILLQKFGFVKKAITGEHYHDLGKLLFGFTIFWAYIAFSQFMLYWYGNIPEEIEFYTHRLHHGWDVISWAMPITHFFVPFFALMSRVLKRVKLILIINCLLVILVHFVDIYWLVLPCYNDPLVEHGPTHLHVGLSDVLPLLGMLSLYIGMFLYVLNKRKLLPLGDPRLTESLSFENF